MIFHPKPFHPLACMPPALPTDANPLMNRLELAKPIRQLAWRPGQQEKEELAVAGEDGSVRICSIDVGIPQET